MALKEYRGKRNFRKTPEPRGEGTAPSGNRFVVQEHHATTLHYDFRLEYKGVLVSWAVPKAPPLPSERGIRRLAIRTEDHPVEYIDFEGEIPQGEYGAGTVLIWDRGEYKPRLWTEKEIKIALRGQKLVGKYVLVHTDSNRWLILKEKEA